MGPFKRAFIVFAAALLVLSCAAAAPGGTEAVPEGSVPGEAPFLADAVLGLFTCVDSGVPEDVQRIDGTMQVEGSTVTDSSLAAVGGSSLSFSPGSSLSFTAGADLYIDGTVSFSSADGGPFSISLGPGSDVLLGGVPVIRCPDVPGASAEIRSTGAFTVSCSSADIGAPASEGTVDMSVSVSASLDVVSQDAEVPAFSVSVSHAGGSSVLDVPRSDADFPEVSVSAEIDADSFYRQIRDGHPTVRMDDAEWWADFLTAPGSEIPDLHVSMEVAGAQTLIRSADGGFRSGSVSSLDIEGVCGKGVPADISVGFQSLAVRGEGPEGGYRFSAESLMSVLSLQGTARGEFTAESVSAESGGLRAELGSTYAVTSISSDGLKNAVGTILALSPSDIADFLDRLFSGEVSLEKLFSGVYADLHVSGLSVSGTVERFDPVSRLQSSATVRLVSDSADLRINCTGGPVDGTDVENGDFMISVSGLAYSGSDLSVDPSLGCRASEEYTESRVGYLDASGYIDSGSAEALEALFRALSEDPDNALKVLKDAFLHGIDADFSFDATDYGYEHWHYTGRMPVADGTGPAELVKHGAWDMEEESYLSFTATVFSASFASDPLNGDATEGVITSHITLKGADMSDMVSSDPSAAGVYGTVSSMEAGLSTLILHGNINILEHLADPLSAPAYPALADLDVELSLQGLRYDSMLRQNVLTHTASGRTGCTFLCDYDSLQAGAMNLIADLTGDPLAQLGLHSFSFASGHDAGEYVPTGAADGERLEYRIGVSDSRSDVRIPDMFLRSVLDLEPEIGLSEDSPGYDEALQEARFRNELLFRELMVLLLKGTDDPDAVADLASGLQAVSDHEFEFTMDCRFLSDTGHCTVLIPGASAADGTGFDIPDRGCITEFERRVLKTISADGLELGSSGDEDSGRAYFNADRAELSESDVRYDNPYTAEESLNRISLHSLSSEVSVDSDSLCEIQCLTFMILRSFMSEDVPDDIAPTVMRLLRQDTAVSADVSLAGLYGERSRTLVYLKDVPYLDSDPYLVLDEGDRRTISSCVLSMGGERMGPDTVTASLDAVFRTSDGISSAEIRGFSLRTAADAGSEFSASDHNTGSAVLDDGSGLSVRTVGGPKGAFSVRAQGMDIRFSSIIPDIDAGLSDLLESSEYTYDTYVGETDLSVSAVDGDGAVEEIRFGMTGLRSSYGNAADGSSETEPGIVLADTLTVRCYEDGRSTADLTFRTLRWDADADPSTDLIGFDGTASSVSGRLFGIGTELDPDMMCLGTSFSFSNLPSGAGFGFVSVDIGNRTTHQSSVPVCSGISSCLTGLRLSGNAGVSVPSGTVDGMQVPSGTTVTAGPGSRYHAVQSADGRMTDGVYLVTAGSEADVTCRHALNLNMGYADEHGEPVREQMFLFEGDGIQVGVPVRTGYDFTGWNAAIPETMPGKDLTFIAGWAPHVYTVSFDGNGGTPDTERKGVAYGGTVKLPGAHRDGYQFAGWRYMSCFIAPGDSFSVPASDITLHAVWSIRVDASGISSADGRSEAEVPCDSVSLSGGAVSKAISEGGGLTVRLSSGTVEFTSDALKRLSGPSGFTLSLSFVDGLADPSAVPEQELSGQGYLVRFISVHVTGHSTGLNGTKVSVPFDLGGLDPSRLTLLHINEVNGNVRQVPAVFADGELTFETDHFSVFAVSEAPAALPSAPSENGGSWGGLIGAAAAVILFVTIAAAVRRRTV